MAGDKQLGNIVYQVEMDVAQLIAAQQKVNQRLDQMDGSFNKSSQSAGRFEGALNKVGLAIAGAFTIETARRLIEIGDQMNTLQARVSALATTTAASTASAAATTAAWTPAAIVASIGSFGGAAAVGLGAVVAALALSGKRKNGGPVSAGGMYQVGEGGMPEIYQASTGKQYMIPGDNGRVISNKEMTAGGGVNVIINVQNMTGATFDAQATSNGDGTITVDAIIADLNNGGPISQGITNNFNTKRTPRGQN